MYARYKREQLIIEENNRREARKLHKRFTWYELKATEPGFISVGIDIGTVTTGYAYSFHRGFSIDPTQVKAPSWAQDGRLSMKTPSSLLLSEDLELLDFGYHAEEKYTYEEGCDKTCFLFRDFKTPTLEQLGENGSPEVTDVSGKKKCSALRIYSLVLGYLSDHFMKRLRVPFKVDASDIFFVLAVPTNSTNVRNFYVKAAKEAGLDEKQVLLVSEAEAALRFCGVNSDLLPREVKDITNTVLVLDVGGRDVNLSMFRKQADGHLDQFHVSKLDGFGFLGIADSVRVLLDSVFKEVVKDREIDSNLAMWLPEIERTLLSLHEKPTLTLRIPIEIFRASKSVEPDFTGTEFEGKVRLSMDRIRLSGELVEKSTQLVLNATTDKLIELFSKGGEYEPETIIMVGGMSNLNFYQSHMDFIFPKKNICVSEGTGNLVVKGAVIFGHEANKNIPLKW